MDVQERTQRVVRRCRAFYAAREPGHFLINAHVPADTVPIPPLYAFDLDRQLHEWLDYQLAAAQPAWQTKSGLDDDSIPVICPRFGIAEHSAWLGAEVRLQETTCLPVPLIASRQDVERLTLNERTKWFGYMKAAYDYLRSRQDGTFVLSVRGTMSPMDIGNALRGDEFFTDLIMEPDLVHRLMAFLVQAIIWYYEKLRSWADEVEGGHFFFYNSSWIGPNCIGHISNDAAMLCSLPIYEEYGFPYESKITERYGCALYHVHNEKLHFVPRVAQLPNLTLLEITNDPKTPPAIEDLPRVFAATGKANLMIHASSDQVRAHIEELKERNVFLDVQCRDRADADDIVAFVRSHSR